MISDTRLKEIALESLNAGPVIEYDVNNKPYPAYIMFFREGPLYAICITDAWLVKENGLELLFSEAKAFAEGIESQQQDAGLCLQDILKQPREFLNMGMS